MHADVDDADEYPENDTGPGISIETSDSASCVDIQKDLENIAGSSASVPADDVGEANVLDYSSQLDVDTDVKAPKINEKVAEVVNKLCLKRVSQEQSKAIIKRHNTPENVKTRLPKCEQSIWNQLPARTRVNDVKFQTTQAMLLASVNCQLEVAETLVKTKASKEVLTSCLDGLTLAMTANYELNQRRRDSIKPQFKFEFAKGLCSSTNPADEFLFGGDTAKRVKEIAELNKSRKDDNSEATDIPTELFDSWTSWKSELEDDSIPKEMLQDWGPILLDNSQLAIDDSKFEFTSTPSSNEIQNIVQDITNPRVSQEFHEEGEVELVTQVGKGGGVVEPKPTSNKLIVCILHNTPLLTHWFITGLTDLEKLFNINIVVYSLKPHHDS
ncbi:hypothetical protein QZH41_002935 [Actinostola sp. cb2023]|nr:hypothetical protein QZH41_002935 [Actinostola sp. cb2023]